MDERLTTTVDKLLLREIKTEPFFVPQSLHIKKYFSYDQSLAEKHFALIQDCGFQTCLKVWKDPKNNEYQLLDGYEQYIAIEKFFRSKGKVEQKIDCLIISGIENIDAKKLSVRLQNISQQSESHLDRCLNIRLMIESNLAKGDIKQIYGVTKSNSAEGKKFQRDYRIAECTPILNRVLGVDLSKDSEDSVLMVLLRPKIRESTLTYGQADRLLTIMGNNQKFIKRFELEYQKYIDRIKEGYFSEEELTKPIFLWRNYNKKRVETIARIAVRLGDQSDYKEEIFFEESKEQDIDWVFNVSETTYKVTYPQISFNLVDKDDLNIKKIVDLKYKTEQLTHSLDSYIKRIRPVQHGAKLRLDTLTATSTVDVNALNLPKLGDQNYFDYIRRNKLLHYCNRNHLLKCIDLNSKILGFFEAIEEPEYNETTTFKKAFEKYEAWYTSEFMAKVREFFDGNHERHPRYSIYIAIRNILMRKASDESRVKFKDFISLLFSEVFSQMDRSEKLKKETIQQKIDSDKNIKSALWDEVKVTLQPNESLDKKINLLKELFSDEWNEIEKAKKEINVNENRVLAEIHKLESNLELITTDVEEYFKATKKSA